MGDYLGLSGWDQCNHRRPPTRLLCPWDSPGKNTGVGCHFLLQCMKVKSESEVAQSCPTLSDPMDCSPPGSSVHGNFQANPSMGISRQECWSGVHCLLQCNHKGPQKTKVEEFRERRCQHESRGQRLRHWKMLHSWL